MRTAFIIAEYNPFHNGHRYHIEQTRKCGADAIAVLMSGNFVQRGDLAVADRFVRAECAVRCGADLVLELPVKYAVANATKFAGGAIRAIEACGLDGMLSFGASASPELLLQACAALQETQTKEQALNLSATKGKSYPAALEQVLREQGRSELADLLKDPNNILGLEYLKSLKDSDRLSPLIIERPREYGHDSTDAAGGFVGAGYIRSLIDAQTVKDPFDADILQEVTPDGVRRVLTSASEKGRFPVDRQKAELMLYARLISKNAADFSKIDNVSQGLENKLAEALRLHATVTDALMEVKSKRYTLARLRQIAVASALGLTRDDTDSTPSFLRVLAFNEAGRRLLSELRETAQIPIVTNLSDVSRRESCIRDAELDYLEGKLFDLCLPSPEGGNPSFLRHPVYVREVGER